MSVHNGILHSILISSFILHRVQFSSQMQKTKKCVKDSGLSLDQHEFAVGVQRFIEIF